MSKTVMIVNYDPGEECRVAVTEDGRLEELQIEPADSLSFVGNIYKGKVMNVEPSIQAAFIDFGLESNGFLHISDLHPQYFPGDDAEKTERIGKKTPRRERPPIQDCLRRGQEIIVQVLKEGINTKGPTLTSYLSIPGRYLVMLPGMDRVGVSRKVEDDDARREMRKVLDGIDLPEGFGYILRTAGMGRSKAELKRDVAYLQRLWKDIDRRRDTLRGLGVLYAESDLLIRSLRDVWTSEVSEIIIDNDAALQRASRFMKIVAPRSATKLLRYDSGEPIFHAFGLEAQIAHIHSREVPMPSGGSLVIDETEAMIAIDVNSGKMRSNSDSETTAFRTNCEAVDEICRQLRLRDIGGLVLCDLIDMIHRSNRRTIETRFRDRLKRDRAATRALPISQFGIVEMTRQRVRGSMRSAHYTDCPSCSGRGMVQKPGSVATWAVRELAALLQHKRVGKVEMVASPRVAGEFLSRRRRQLTNLETETNKTISVRISDDIAADRIIFYAYDQNGADLDLGRLEKPKAPRDLQVWEYDPKRDEEFSPDALAGVPYMEDIDVDAELGEASEQQQPEASSEDESDKPKRRRRRRGGRGRRRGGDGEQSQETQESRAEGESSNADDATEEREVSEPREPREERAPREQSEQREGEGEGEGRGRRRRRRGGRGRNRGGEPRDGEPRGEQREESRSSRPSRDQRDEIPNDEADVEMIAKPIDDLAPRGDSWDLTPEDLEEIARIRGTKLPKPTMPRSDQRAEPEPRSKPKVAPEKVEPAAVEEPVVEAVEPVETESEPIAEEKPAPKAKTRRKRTTKKTAARKTKAAEASEASEAPVDEPAGESEDAPKDDATPVKTTKKTKAKRTRKKAASKATTAKKTAAKKTAEASADETSGDEPAAKPTVRKKAARRTKKKSTTTPQS